MTVGYQAPVGLALRHLEEASVLATRTLGGGWSTAVLRAELNRDDRCWLAIEDDGLVAFAGMGRAGATAEILALVVRPDRRRRGLGRTLGGALVDTAVDQGADEVWLELRPGNDAARALYQALGFEAVGRRPGYYADGEAAVLMTRRLAPTSGGR